MAKKPQSAPARATEADPLHESVDRLAIEIRLLREVMDEMREDVSWVTRNGLPHQPIEHVVVKQMARDPCAKDWGKRLLIERHTNSPYSPLDSVVLNYVAEDIEATFEAITKGQLEIVLTALDKVRSQLQSAIKRPEQVAGSPISTEPASAPIATPEKPPKGHLF